MNKKPEKEKTEKTRVHEAGKGDTPRPLSVDRETWNKNYDRIFRKKKKRKRRKRREDDNEKSMR